jgi:methyltransferase family protein
MSFFAACQVSQYLQANTECVAVDSWIGDPHASFHSSAVLQEFKENLTKNYPDAYFIQGMFAHALHCFENESIDLLHIDGYHTYNAVKEDFDSWLGKMSDTGVIILHDINVHERNFGVWQVWQELCERYIGLSFMHSHGLGVLYVGRQDNSIAHIFRWLIENPAYLRAAQKYLEILGENAVNFKATEDELRQIRQTNEEKDATIKLMEDEMRSLRQVDDERRAKIAEQDNHISRIPAANHAIVGDGRIVIPLSSQLGSDSDYLRVITKALERLIGRMRVRRLLFLPFRRRRRRYRKQLKIAKELARIVSGA